MSFTYVVLGAGRQGTAAAYDLARHGNAARVSLADRDGLAARRAADRVNRLLGSATVEPMAIDATDVGTVAKALTGVDAALSAVPYVLNLCPPE